MRQDSLGEARHKKVWRWCCTILSKYLLVKYFQLKFSLLKLSLAYCDSFLFSSKLISGTGKGFLSHISGTHCQHNTQTTRMTQSALYRPSLNTLTKILAFSNKMVLNKYKIFVVVSNSESQGKTVFCERLICKRTRRPHPFKTSFSCHLWKVTGRSWR